MAVLILIVIVCFIYIKTMGRKARQTKKEKEFNHHDNYMMSYPDVSDINLFACLMQNFNNEIDLICAG